MNIKSNELRIGNLARYSEGGTIFKICDIYNNGLGVENLTEKTWIEISEFEPIPISEELLLKAGFIKGDTGNIYLYANRYHKIEISSSLNKVWLSDTKIEHIKHIHQLQNLYFALTGEELEFI
jgi:hypothetical protein